MTEKGIMHRLGCGLMAMAMGGMMLMSHTARAQQDPVLMEVGGEKITREQFVKEFEENVGSRLAKGTSAAERRKALDEYVELYANFRAKMLDAHALGFDSTPSLLRDMAKYRKELAAPYLIDSAAMRGLMETAYERNHYMLNATHILVQCEPGAEPEDTLKAYNRIWSLYERAMAGEDFHALAREEALRAHGNRPDWKASENEGDLRWFTAFDMVYQFEDAVYALKIGEVSKPIRTRFGYHIIKLNDKAKYKGNMEVAHIWLGTRDSAGTRTKIYNCYQRLMSGTPFEEMARVVSDDRTSRERGGLLPDATYNNLPPEYVEQLKTMRTGDISAPFFTQYGWHILKLVSAEELAPIEDMEAYYRQRMARDQRGDMSRKTFAQSAKKKYGMIDNTKLVAPGRGRKMRASLDELIANLPDSVQKGTWSGVAPWITDLRPLVTLGERNYDARDLANYIHKTQARQLRTTMEYLVKTKYEDFMDSIVLVYADSRLEEEHPDFAALLEDYRRGLMIFDYNEKLVWAKAIEDTAGFAEYYRRSSATKRMDRESDSVFFWNERARVKIVDISDSTCIKRSKLQKVMEKLQKQDISTNELVDVMTAMVAKKNKDGKCTVTADVDVIERKKQSLIADSQWQPGIYIEAKDRGYRVVMVDYLMPRQLKARNEARGYYLNEYQNDLEQRLNESLREKYNVKIHRDVVESIEL